jgi:chromatin remodeling complex protein RSC6
MATETETPVVEPKATENTNDHLKVVLQTLLDFGSQIKTLTNTVRQVIKDSDRQTKELEKLRNKRNRTKVERAAGSSPSGITKPVSISDELAVFLGVAPGTLVPRNEVTKGVSGYVKENNLSDPENKQKFILDDRPAAQKLRKLLGNPAESVTYFNLQRYLKQHYILGENVVATPKKKAAVVEPPVATPPPVAEPVKIKKTVMVKKVKSSPLVEEA